MNEIYNVMIELRKHDIECGYLKRDCEITKKINKILKRHHNGYVIWNDGIVSEENKIVSSQLGSNAIPYLECEMSKKEMVKCKMMFDGVYAYV